MTENRSDGYKHQGQDMVAVAAVVTIVVMTILVCHHGEIVIGMSDVMEVVIMGMRTQHHVVAYRMIMHDHRRRPSVLERDDKHENEGDQAAHDGIVGAMIPKGQCQRDRRN